MDANKFEKILNVMNVPLEYLTSNFDLDEADIYRLLSGKVSDKFLLDKISHALAISKNDLTGSGNVLLQSVFSSFNQPFYIFRLYALEEIKSFNLSEYFSFIPNHCNMNFILIEGLLTLRSETGRSLFIKDESFSISGKDGVFHADFAENTIVLVYVNYNSNHLLA